MKAAGHLDFESRKEKHLVVTTARWRKNRSPVYIYECRRSAGRCDDNGAQGGHAVISLLHDKN